MNKHSVFLVPFVVFLFLQDSYQHQKKKKHIPVPGDIGRWSGTVTSEGEIIYSNAVFNGKLEVHATASFTDALPTLFRNDETTDLNFTDDKGQGYHKVHEEITNILIKKKCIGDCEGNGQAELHAVVINEETNTYDIDVLFPDCVGTSNCQENGVYKADPVSATVSNHPLTNKNLLAGTNTVTGELPGGLGTFTRTITWHLVRSPDVVELIVTPEDYETWMPEPGKDETTKGSVMGIELELRNSNGGPPSLKAVSFELTLEQTSTEPGITINAPLNPVNNLPDIRFLPQANGHTSTDFQKLIINCNKCTSASASLAAYDGGGWTTLTVKATLEDNSVIEGVLISTGGPKKIPIPKRSPGSHIASFWLATNNNPQETDDIESSTGNTNYGDGLSAYEEYRGVISEGKFNRLDPMKKEVGVKIKRAEIPLFSDGIKKFENASDLRVIRFFENEIGVDRRLNKNFKTANVYQQYTLFLQLGALTGALGNSFGSPAIPKQVSKTVIDKNKIGQSYQDRLAEARDMNMTLTYSENDLFTTVTAHELSHSVNVKHHGSMAPNSLDLTITANKTAVRIFNHQGVELQKPQHITGRGGDTGNEQSGDVNCFMLNNALCDWAVKITPDSVFFYEVPLIPLGTTLCTSKDGTGLNSKKDANGNYIYFGDATNGNCLSQIKLK